MTKRRRIYHNTLVECLRAAAAGDPDARAAASLAVRIAQHKSNSESPIIGAEGLLSDSPLEEGLGEVPTDAPPA